MPMTVIYPHGLEIMVDTMEQFPEAGLGVSQKVVEDVKTLSFFNAAQRNLYP